MLHTEFGAGLNLGSTRSSIVPGKGDLVLAGPGRFDISPGRDGDTKVLWTMVGKTVYRAK